MIIYLNQYQVVDTMTTNATRRNPMKRVMICLTGALMLMGIGTTTAFADLTSKDLWNACAKVAKFDKTASSADKWTKIDRGYVLNYTSGGGKKFEVLISWDKSIYVTKDGVEIYLDSADPEQFNNAK